MRMTHCVFIGLLFICGIADAKAATEMSEQYHGLQQMQKDLHRLPSEKQEQLQPKVRQAELQACQKLREEQRKGVRPETYQEEGGAELLAFVQQFDHYCQMLQ
jgi:nitrate/nitrite-specific signal transduction histidine kinase